jgi:GNAT superfamily N-acetyltransferase
MTDFEIVFDPLPHDALTRHIFDQLVAYNLAVTGVSTYYPVGLFLKNARGEWLGGLTAEIWGGWLHIKMLWVDAVARKQGNGTRLLRAAEEYAVERGCFAATVETHSFQARPFYEKCGYEVFGTLEDWPPGHQKYFLRKRLAERVSP